MTYHNDFEDHAQVTNLTFSVQIAEGRLEPLFDQRLQPLAEALEARHVLAPRLGQDRAAAAAAAHLALHHLQAQPLLATDLEAPDESWRRVELTELARFFANPARYMLLVGVCCPKDF